VPPAAVLEPSIQLCTLYRRSGQPALQEHFTTATTMYREMGMTYWLERAEAEMRESI